MARIVVRQNTEGYIQAGVFHPIRSGAGYDPSYLSDDREYTRERKRRKATAKKAKKTAKRKPVAKKKAKARKKNPSPRGVRMYSIGYDTKAVIAKAQARADSTGKPVNVYEKIADRRGKPVTRWAYTAKPRASNPASFPIGRFVKVEKVRVNKDGTVSILKKKGSR